MPSRGRQGQLTRGTLAWICIVNVPANDERCGWERTRDATRGAVSQRAARAGRIRAVRRGMRDYTLLREHAQGSVVAQAARAVAFSAHKGVTVSKRKWRHGTAREQTAHREDFSDSAEVRLLRKLRSHPRATLLAASGQKLKTKGKRYESIGVWKEGKRSQHRKKNTWTTTGTPLATLSIFFFEGGRRICRAFFSSLSTLTG